MWLVGLLLLNAAFLADSQNADAVFSAPRITTESGGFTVGNCDLDDLVLGMTVPNDIDTMLFRQGGLITRALTSFDPGPDEGPFIGILRSQVVCTAAGTEQGKIGSVSVVVNYLCSEQPFCQGVENRTEQFQFDCTEDNTWDPRIVEGFVRSVTGASFDTTPSDMCGQCLDPGSILNPNDPLVVITDPDNHCTGECSVPVCVADEET